MDPTTQEGTGEKALGTLGSAGGYLVGGRMGLLGSAALGTGLGYLGGKAGKIFGGGKKAPAEAEASPLAALPSRPATVFARRQVAQAVPEVGRLVGPG
jgi:hypothetical protein